MKPNLVKERITDGQGYNRDFAHKIDGLEDLRALNPTMPEGLLVLWGEKIKDDS